MLVRILGVLLTVLIVDVAFSQPPEFDRRGDRLSEGEFGEEGRRGRPGPPSNAMFDAIDLDGDGVISTRELRRSAAALKKLDTDGDGNITLEEVSPRGAGRGAGRRPGGSPEAMVDRIMENDADGDGFLTEEEVPERMMRMLSGADQNGDGVLDRSEVTQAMEARGDRFGGRGRSGAEGRSGRQGARGSDPNAMAQELMSGDRNGDGLLSPQEVPREMMPMLRGADQNGDGFLNRNEVRAATANRRQRERRDRLGREGFDPTGNGTQGLGRERNRP